MRSLNIINVMLGKEPGGIEQAFIDYLVAFERLNHTSIGILSKGVKGREELSPYIQLQHISNFGEWDIFASMRLKQLINKICPDVIITHGRRAAKLIKLAVKNIPVVGVTHNYSLDYLLKLDYVFATTQDLKNHLINLGYDETKIFYVPNMINLNSIKVKANPSQIKFRSPPVIGTMGRFVKKKGFDLFIKALSILKDEGIDFRAIIGGDGEELSNLKNTAKSLHLQDLIEFPGWIINKEIFFSDMDIFCLPSLHEPFGIALLEALSYKKPIVSFNSEGPFEIGTDKKDLLFAELGNERDLAEKIKLLLTKKELASKLIKAGSDLIRKKYSLDAVQTFLDKYVKKIAGISA